METMYRKSALAAAVSALLMLAACGGGNEAETAKAADADDVSAAASQDDALTEVRNRLKKAADMNIAKIAYSVTSELGAYGKTLKEDGWQIISIAPANLSNEPSTIVIANSESKEVDPASLYESFKEFKGVLIIDSNKLIANSKSGYKDRIWDEAKGSFVDPVEEEDKNQNTEIDEVNPAADFYAAMTRGEAAKIPLGTGVITSATTNSIMAIEVHPNGGVNGSKPEERNLLVNPLLNALTAHEELEKERSASFTAKVSPPPRGWDRMVDFVQDDLGWRLVGRVYAEALRTNDDKRYMVAVDVFTGNNKVACSVNGFECGVYPTHKDHLVISLDKDIKQGKGVRIDVMGPAVAYAAFAKANPAKQVMDFMPRAAEWTATSARENDAWDKTWSEGYSIGASAGPSTAGSFSASMSAAYSRTNSYRKTTHQWDAVDYQTPGASANGAPFTAWTKIVAKRRSVLPGIYTNEEFLWPSLRPDKYGDGGRRNMREFIVGARYCKSPTWSFAAYQNNKWEEGLGRSKMQYEGWNPAFSSTFEVHRSRIVSGTAQFVDVNAGVTLQRPIYHMMRTDKVYCENELKPGGWGYHVINPYNGAPFQHKPIVGRGTNRWQDSAGDLAYRQWESRGAVNMRMTRALFVN